MKLSYLVPFALFLAVGAVGCGKGKDSPVGDKPIEPLGSGGSATGSGTASGSGSASATATVAPTTPTPDQEKLLVDLGSVKDAVCACPDRACVEKAVKAGTAFDDRLNTMYEDESKIPTAVKTQVDAIQKGIETCTTRIGGANAPLSAATTKVLAEFDALSTAICACRDRACADALMPKAKTLEDKLKATTAPTGDIPEEALSRMAAVELRSQACVAKL